MNAPWSKVKSLSALFAVLVLGMLIGALLTWNYSRNMRDFDRRDPDGALRFVMDNLQHELHLSSAQQSSILEVVRSRMTEMKVIHRLIEPQQATLRAQMQGQIRAQLTPEQLAKFDELLNTYSRKLLFISGPPPLKPSV